MLALRRYGPDGKELPRTAHVFGSAQGEYIGPPERAWRRAGRKAAVTGLTLHDLRREFGSRCLETGAAPHTVQKLLGHAALTTTSRYLEASMTVMERAIAGLDSFRTVFARSAPRPEEGAAEASPQPTV